MSARGPVRVLIVDDDPDLAGSLADYLALDGVAADTVGTGREGVQAAAATAYDWVVMDVGLPGGNGIESMRAILAARPDTRVLLMTGHSASFLRDTPLDPGSTEVLTKPIDPAALSRRLRGLE